MRDSIFNPNDKAEQISLDTALRAGLAQSEPRVEVYEIRFMTQEDDETLPDDVVRMLVWFRMIVTGQEDIFSYDLQEVPV